MKDIEEATTVSKSNKQKQLPLNHFYVQRIYPHDAKYNFTFFDSSHYLILRLSALFSPAPRRVPARLPLPRAPPSDLPFAG